MSVGGSPQLCYESKHLVLLLIDVSVHLTKYSDAHSWSEKISKLGFAFSIFSVMKQLIGALWLS